jgi:hypothetical protein
MSMKVRRAMRCHHTEGGGSAGCEDSDTPNLYNGLIQHSFALRLHKDHRPFAGGNTQERVSKRFGLGAIGGAGFCVKAVGRAVDHAKQGPETGGGAGGEQASAPVAKHSPLVHEGVTSVARRSIPMLERGADGGYLEDLPKALSWAACLGNEESWQKFIFARRDGDGEANDFFVEESDCVRDEDQTLAISRALAQLFAHRRSLLFGIDLANNFVNVMLPHAVLKPDGPLIYEPTDASNAGKAPCARGPLLMQPLVTLRRAHHASLAFRRVYSLTLLLIPLEEPERQEGRGRPMSVCEINALVNAGWGLASAPPFDEVGRYVVSGPLTSYVTRLDPGAAGRLRATMGGAGSESEGSYGKCPAITLRQATETLMFAVEQRMVCGPAGATLGSTGLQAGSAGPSQLERRIGDGTITSLGNSRVTSVVVVDGELKEEMLDDRSGQALPGSLHQLMKVISAPETRIADRRRFRLDRPFFDRDDYAIGTLPASSCVVAVFDPAKQQGRYESALTHAGWLGYMTLGAATAIGTIRGIHRDLERTDLSKPKPEAVAAVEREVVVDLSEIYDLDITWDAYRLRYRRLRDQLGITSDYEALQRKLEALYRETSACSEAKTQRWLIVLTAAIVALSLLILAGTIVIAVKSR